MLKRLGIFGPNTITHHCEHAQVPVPMAMKNTTLSTYFLIFEENSPFFCFFLDKNEYLIYFFRIFATDKASSAIISYKVTV